MSSQKANRTIYCKHPVIWEKAKKIADAMGIGISEVIMEKLMDYVRDNEHKAEKILELRNQTK
jgi:hypothetical protein